MRVLLLTVAMVCACGWAMKPSSDEMRVASEWWAVRFGDGRKKPTAEPPFSFTYGGRASADVLKWCEVARTTQKLDSARTERAVTYTAPDGLVVTCRAVTYSDYPTVEWTLYLKYTGKTDTPVIEGVQALDARLAGKSFRLHHFTGALAGPNDYQPFDEELSEGGVKRITAAGGRPTNSDLPYFNVDTGGGGVIAVVGWPGQWAAEFKRDGAGLGVKAGQELTHFVLHPGEEVRTPLIALQFYRGDWVRAQNVWRSWMLAHNVPKLDGKPIHPFASACNGNHYPGIITNAAEEMHFLRRYLEEGIKPDFWWEDAGWYKCGDPPNWGVTGTWEVDPARWPKGIREVSDWGRSNGIRTTVWFEPERVTDGTWIAQNHPEWVLGGDKGGLLNLGDLEARAWLTDHIDKLLTDQGIDLYRQDYNIDPLPYWRANDAEDRQGITEIRYVEGYLAYWDELKRRHNGMLIDSCASGGRRNDLETLRRAVPLLRSDYIFEPVGEQGHTYGISFWMPFNGTGFMTFDKYLIRSQMSPEFTLGVDTRKTDADYDLLRKLFKEWKEVSPCYAGDYYPLTNYTLANDAWMAWQFDRPDLGGGFFQAFRRADCPTDTLTVKLHGLDAKASYVVTDLDNPTPRTLTGRELMAGFTVTAGEKPAALVYMYRKAK